MIIKKILNRLWNVILETEIFILHLAGYIPFHWIRKLIYWAGGIKMHWSSTIHMGARFYDGRNIVIGRDTIIGEKVVLDGRDKLIIGDHVAFASEVMVYNSWHDMNDEKFTALSEPVIIEDYVFIGPRSIILPGVKIGRGTIVAAGSVVTKDIEPFVVVAGIPAVKMRERELKNPHYKLGRPRLFR